MKTVTQKVFGFLYKTCLANPGGIPSPTTIQRAFAVGTPTEDLTAATFEPDREHGGAFDWYDILAGMTLPVLFWVGSLIVLIVK